MSLGRLRGRVEGIISAHPIGIEIYFLIRTSEGLSIKKIDMNAEDLAELLEEFKNSIAGSLSDESLSLLELSAADERRNAIYRYDLVDIPEQLRQLNVVLENDDFSEFNSSHDSLKSLEGMIIMLGSGRDKLAVYKQHYPVSLLSTSFSFVRLRRESRFEKFEGDILRINPKFEFMRVDDQLYVLDLKILEKFFGFRDAISRAAMQRMDSLRRADIVDNIALIETRLNDLSFARKIIRATANGTVLGVIPNVRIINFIRNHTTLRGKLKLNDDGTKIRLETKVSQDLFMKLLNDDYLRSELTEKDYESLAKDILAQET